MILASKIDKNGIRDTPAIENLLSRMPSNVANSFSDEQLIHLYTAIGARDWGQHAVDIRGVCKIPFYHWCFYYVLLIGRNRRYLSRKERKVSAFTTACFFILFAIFSILCGLLALYLIKSALGINLFKGFSLGIWGWFNEN